MTTTDPAVGASLASLLTPTDELAASSAGRLLLEGADVDELLGHFGSPLFVISERTLRKNVRRIRAAFAAVWPADVRILYAIKANSNLAVRAVMHEEGLGGDCFGLGELYATFAGGADPSLVTLNGSNKSREELEAAASLGVYVNIDSVDEIEELRQIASARSLRVRVNIRLKVAPAEFDRFPSDFFAVVPGHLRDAVRREKWGFSVEAARFVIEKIARAPELELVGYHIHLGRLGRDPGLHQAWANAYGEAVVELFEATGFAPMLLDIGGGWPRERDPESRTLEHNPHSIEVYAKAVASSLLPTLRQADLPTPVLWLEPGRYIVGNAAILAGRIGAVKHDLGLTWANVDFSTNDLTRIDSAACAHHILPTSRLCEPAEVEAILVGKTCALSVIRDSVFLPKPERGDGIAVLDAGMYAETTANQYNSIPRPATVLVRDGDPSLIKERETLDDLFRGQRLPAHLKSGTQLPPREFFSMLKHPKERN